MNLPEVRGCRAALEGGGDACSLPLRGGCVDKQPHSGVGLLLAGRLLGLRMLPPIQQKQLLHWRGATRSPFKTSLISQFDYLMICGGSQHVFLLAPFFLLHILQQDAIRGKSCCGSYNEQSVWTHDLLSSLLTLWTSNCLMDLLGGRIRLLIGFMHFNGYPMAAKVRPLLSCCHT